MSIEQKIAEILAESKLDEAEAAEDILEDQAEDVVAEETEEVNEEELKPSKKEDEANNKKNAVDKNPQGDKAKAVKEEKDCDDEDDDDEDDEDEVKVKKESYKKMKKEEVEAEDEMIVDVKEDVDALVNGEDLSEEFKAKATTIFEAAIVSRVKQEVAKLEEEFEAKLEESVAES